MEAVLRNSNVLQEGTETMKIFIPTPLRVYTEKQDAVEVAGATVGEALASLTTMYPDFQKHLYTGEGKLRSFVNVYLNDDDVRYLPEGEQTPVKDNDTLSIIPSIAGGTGRAGERAFGACCCCD
jgi:adenylyltransferase/sulfurtransferase